MAASARALRAVKPHVPMIKFPLRKPDVKEMKSVYEPGGAPVKIFNTVEATSTVKTSSSNSPPVGSLPRGSGIDCIDLPKKYQRKLISIEEMEYIERGGPE